MDYNLFITMDTDTIKTMLLNSDLSLIRDYCQTNKEAAKICQDEYFWQQLVEKHFNTSHKLLTTWRSTYEMLNTPLYQVISATHYPHNEVDIKTETFSDIEKALDYAVDEAMNLTGSLIGTAALDLTKYNFSLEFRELLDDVGFEDLEGNVPENSDLRIEYDVYVDEYRKHLRQVLFNGETIVDQEYFNMIKIIKKQIIS